MGAVLFRDGSRRGSLGLGGHRFELIKGFLLGEGFLAKNYKSHIYRSLCSK